MKSRMLMIVGLLIVAILGAWPALTLAQSANDATPGSEETSQPRPVFAIQKYVSDGQGYFLVTLEPGESAELISAVRTEDSMPLELRAYATNAFTRPNGGMGVDTDDEPRVGPSTWIDFPAQRFTLGSTDELVIPFSVTVPEGTAPGQYVAALVAQTDGPLPIEGVDFFDQIILSAIQVVIEVPGERFAGFELGTPSFDVRPGSLILSVPISNTGNTLVRPQGAIVLQSVQGEVVGEAPIKMGSVYAFTSTSIEVALPPQLPAGDYLISASLADPDSGFSASIDSELIVNDVATEVLFHLDPVSVVPIGDPIQLADVAITIVNNGPNIPTGKIVLHVYHDDELVEAYLLSQNQAMPRGASTVTTRYLPLAGWQEGVYSFEIVVSSIAEDGTETVLATLAVEDTIEIP